MVKLLDPAVLDIKLTCEDLIVMFNKDVNASYRFGDGAIGRKKTYALTGEQVRRVQYGFMWTKHRYEWVDEEWRNFYDTLIASGYKVSIEHSYGNVANMVVKW